MLAQAANRAAKHNKENVSDLPKTVTGADYRTNMG
jgi:hypothetical protein